MSFSDAVKNAKKKVAKKGSSGVKAAAQKAKRKC